MGIFKKEQLNKEKEGFEKEKEEKEFFTEAQKEIEKPKKDITPLIYKPKDDDEEVRLKKEAEKIRKIKFEGRKLKYLVSLAKEKGAKYAVGVAKKTNDACLLDLLHDRLIEEGIEN